MQRGGCREAGRTLIFQLLSSQVVLIFDAVRHGRRHDEVSYCLVGCPPIPVRDFIVRGTAQRASCKAGFLWQSLRRTARDVSRSDVHVAS